MLAITYPLERKKKKNKGRQMGHTKKKILKKKNKKKKEFQYQVFGERISGHFLRLIYLRSKH
jgi:hypothetical protein